MAATIIDSAIFQGIFTHRRDAPRLVRREPHRRSTSTSKRRWPACRAGSGLIPQEAADEIVSHCRHRPDRHGASCASRPSASAIRSSASCRSSTQLCRDKLGEYCHWGATTQDITDTATVLQIREALATRRGRTGGDLRRRWPSSRRTHRDTPMIGRSNLQQAIPVTFGYKMAGLLSAIERHRERLAQLKDARAGRRVRRRRRHAGVAREGRDGDAGRPVRRAGPGAAGDRLAHDPRQHRRGRRASWAWSAARWASSAWTSS